MDGAEQVRNALRQIQTGQREAAAATIRELTSANVDLADLWIRVARAALSIGELTLATSCARRFLNVNRKQTQRTIIAAGTMAEAGRFEQALKAVRPHLKRAPDDPSLNHLVGTIYQQLGETQLASKHLRTTLKAANLAGATWLTLAAQHKFTADDPLMEQLLGLQRPMSASDNLNRLQYQYALGKALLDVREYDQAFDAFETGAKLAPGAGKYDRHRDSKRVNAIIAGNAGDAVAAVCGPDEGESKSLFVIGLPRSGTTLLQRILTAHKAIADGGEFSGMGVASMELRRQSLDSCARLCTLPDLGRRDLRNLAGTYLHLATERFGSQGRIIDKSINNTYYAGLIAKAFPQAPVIVVERNILDIAWSVFRTCFSQGMDWSWSQGDIAAHLRSQMRLIDHWKTVLADRVISVSYEKLVSASTTEFPRIVSACGLEDDPNVFNFHQHKTPVTTSSVAQVNKPLNKRSIGIAETVRHRLQEFIDAYSD